MSLHQIIHAGCKSGLYGSASGFGILSSDRDFPRQNDFADKLSVYKAPDLDMVNPEYSERIVALMPVSYTYRYSGGECAITRSACLGKSAFTGGMDHISHSILFSYTDINTYPCDFIGSPSFLSAPSPDTVYAENGAAAITVTRHGRADTLVGLSHNRQQGYEILISPRQF